MRIWNGVIPSTDTLLSTYPKFRGKSEPFQLDNWAKLHAYSHINFSAGTSCGLSLKPITLPQVVNRPMSIRVFDHVYIFRFRFFLNY